MRYRYGGIVAQSKVGGRRRLEMKYGSIEVYSSSKNEWLEEEIEDEIQVKRYISFARMVGGVY